MNAPRAVLLIARTTFIELRRERWVLVTLGLCCALIFISMLLGSLTLAERLRVLVHLGLSAIQLALWVLAAFVSAHILHREISRQTCLMVLARPLDRLSFLMGKACGVALVLLQMLLIFTVVLSLLVYVVDVNGTVPLMPLLESVSSIFFEGLVISSLAFFFSTFMQPGLAGASALAVTLMGHWLPDLQFFAQRSGELSLNLLNVALQWSVPQFYKFNFKSIAWITAGGDLNVMGLMILHSLGWSLLLMILAGWIFRRRDLT